MPDEQLYVARCPECQAVVAAATPRCVKYEPTMLPEWLGYGLSVERLSKEDAVAQLRRHSPGCKVAPVHQGESPCPTRPPT